MVQCYDALRWCIVLGVMLCCLSLCRCMVVTCVVPCYSVSACCYVSWRVVLCCVAMHVVVLCRHTHDVLCYIVVWCAGCVLVCYASSYCVL